MAKKPVADRVDDTSPDMKAELLARLKSVVPEAFSDGKLDLERLTDLAGDAVATGPERYGLTWPGKRDSIAMLQAPTGSTLVPDRAASVNFDDARHVFPSPTGKAPMGAHAPTKALERARSAIGLEDFRIHDLRRTAATRMAELGISPHTISLILNHASARKGSITSKVYVQYSYDKEKREALEAWSGLLLGLVQRT
jgi:integrase